MVDQLYYDAQQIIGLFERIAIATERMADILDEMTKVKEEEACSPTKTEAVPDSTPLKNNS